MQSARHEEIIESIFVNNQIVPGHLKDFLKMISNKLCDDDQSNFLQIKRNEDIEEEITQAKYLDMLISQCEQRLANLAVNPKTKVVIRNEGKKLNTIFEDIKGLKFSCNNLQSQIDEVANAQKELRKLECEKKQHYQDMINNLYTESLNSEICNLRRLYYDLKNPTNELTVKCSEMKKEIKTIQERILILEKIPVLEKKVTLLLDWRALLREEYEIFEERYEHIKTTSITRCEVADHLKKKVDFINLDKYIKKIKFNEARKEFASEFNLMKELSCEMQLQLNAKIVSLHKDVQRALTELAYKRRREKRSNKVKEAMSQ